MVRDSAAHSWSDDSSSYAGDDFDESKDRGKFDIPAAPDVLYTINYVDRSRGLYGVVGSNEPMDPERSATDSDELVCEADGEPVIEIRSTAICAPRDPKAKLPTFKPIYRAAVGPDASDDEKAAAAQQDQAVAAATDRIRVDRVDRECMIIHSPHLRDALAAVDDSGRLMRLYAPYFGLFHRRAELARFRDDQPACHGGEQRAVTARHIDVLLGFVEEEFGERARAEARRYENSPPTATYDNAWMLYKAGEVVYAKQRGRVAGPPRWRAYVIKSVDFGQDDDGDDYMKVHCWCVAYTGGALRRTATLFTVPEFTGEQAISSLPVVPARFFPEDPAKQGGLAMAEWQIKQGREYWALLKGPAYKEFVVGEDEAASKGEDGEEEEEGDGDETEEASPAPRLQSAAAYSGTKTERIVIDLPGYERFSRPQHQGGPSAMGPMQPHGGGVVGAGLQPPAMRPVDLAPRMMDNGLVPLFAPRCSCDACAEERARQPQKMAAGPLAEFNTAFLDSRKTPTTDLFYLVCTTEVPGFLLSERRWIFVDMAQLRPVRPDREAFESLVLDDAIKRTVRALVGKFAHGGGDGSSAAATGGGRVAPWPRDLVKNKGEGRIFLLHGSPGVGKTCTAECVAELAQRPLLALTSGDISTDMRADAVERNLDRYLRLGERYGAMVLLDEADVFLEARRASDLQRNGLVSVFLRALEYFRGVLFLTTNRVETFDAAFTSRIHVALHYRPLSVDDRRRVWAHHFARLERDSGGRVFALRSAREYAYDDAEVHALQLNGREIRNALQTAVALAEEDAAGGAGEQRGDDEDDGEGEDKALVTVTEQHLRAIVKMSSGFKSFMIHGPADSE